MFRSVFDVEKIAWRIRILLDSGDGVSLLRDGGEVDVKLRFLGIDFHRSLLRSTNSLMHKSTRYSATCSPPCQRKQRQRVPMEPLKVDM